MRCLTNSAFLFSGPSGRRKARQKDFLLRKAKVRGSESRDLMRIGRSFGEKKQVFASKEVSVSRKCLLLFEISPNVFPDYSYCFRSEAQKWTESFRLLLWDEQSGSDKKLCLEGYHCLSVACPLESSAVLFVFGLFGLRKQSCRIAIGGVFRRVPFPRAERKQSERIEISFGQNVKTALLSGNE